MNARKHHYVSQCYLKNFCMTSEKTRHVFVYDKSLMRGYSSNIKDIACKRDYNRLELPNEKPDVLETSFSKFEKYIDQILQSVVISKHINDESLSPIIYLASLFHIRNPEFRGNFETSHNKILQMAAKLARSMAQSKEEQIKILKRSNLPFTSELNDETINVMENGNGYGTSLNRTVLIQAEIDVWTRVFNDLERRKWRLVKFDQCEGHLVTSDRPVVLCPRDGQCYPKYIGTGTKNTTLYFPLSCNLALIGEFENETIEIPPNNYYIAMLNSIMFSQCISQVYSSKQTFSILMENDTIQQFNTGA